MHFIVALYNDAQLFDLKKLDKILRNLKSYFSADYSEAHVH